ncbi:MAG: hypothetical protein JJU32_03790 [Phormidium sp. BM_Day4_Bin.17]|nr:hypothetical protein [Phormidium sp. BM_Day4_Bin.17]
MTHSWNSCMGQVMGQVMDVKLYGPLIFLIIIRVHSDGLTQWIEVGAIASPELILRW